MRYEEMRPHQIEEVLRKAPIAYIPWGAHEWHGPHNPIGLDTLKCQGQCLALCRETGGVVLPPVYCGYQTMKPCRAFAHTLEFRKETVRDLLLQHLEGLHEEGFRVMVVVMGHYGRKHQEIIQEAVALFTERHYLVRVWAFPDYEPTGADGFGGDHAGINETSLMMFLRPELVDLGRLPEPVEQARDGISSAEPVKGATAERGARIMASLVKNAAPKIRGLLDEANAAHAARFPASR